MKCLYGVEDIHQNVTDIVKNNFMKGDNIEIPQYTVFNDYFKDVVKNELKTLTININNKKILISEDDIQKRSYKIDKEGNIYYKQNSQFRVIFGNRQQQTDITHRIKTKFYKEDKIIIQQDLDFRIEFGNAGNIGLYDNDMIILFPNKHYIINERDVYDKEHIIDVKTAVLEKKILKRTPIDYQKYKVPNWMPTKDSKIYLIANNKDLDTNIFKIIKEDDLVVCFNLNFFEEHFKNHKNKIIMIRAQHDYTCIGYKEKYDNNFLQTYFLTGYVNNDFNKFKDTKQHVHDSIFINLLKEIQYPHEQVFTTGFFAYHFLKKIYDIEVILLGYTFENLIHTGYGWVGHNTIWEKKYTEENNINVITENVSENNINTKMDKYVEKILTSKIIQDPFPHIIIDNFLDDKLYQKLIDEVHSNDLFNNTFSDHNRSTVMCWDGDYKENIILDHRYYRNIFVSILLNNKIRESIFSKFIKNKNLHNDIMFQHNGTSIQLDCFRGNYEYPIHTDIKGKLITILLYLPKDNKMSHLGTNVYNDKKELYKNVEYKKNRLVCFSPVQEHDPKNNKFISYHNMEGKTDFNFRRYSLQSWYTTYKNMNNNIGQRRSGKNTG
jgi:hypothetical protein